MPKCKKNYDAILQLLLCIYMYVPATSWVCMYTTGKVIPVLHRILLLSWNKMNSLAMLAVSKLPLNLQLSNKILWSAGVTLPVAYIHFQLVACTYIHVYTPVCLELHPVTHLPCISAETSRGTDDPTYISYKIAMISLGSFKIFELQLHG